MHQAQLLEDKFQLPRSQPPPLRPIMRFFEHIITLLTRALGANEFAFPINTSQFTENVLRTFA